jgi:hypothetical protein
MDTSPRISDQNWQREKIQGDLVIDGAYPSKCFFEVMFISVGSLFVGGETVKLPVRVHDGESG